MKLPIRNTLLVLITLLSLLSACGSSASNSNSSTAQKSAVPDHLSRIEALAEDIMDFVPGGEWSKVNSDIADIEKAWSTYQPQAIQDGATQAAQDSFSESLSRLKSASSSHSASNTLQATNDLSAAVINMFDLYKPVIPTDLGRLDVLERQIILDVANQNFNAASATLVKIKSVWQQVKPSVLEHKGQSVAEQFTSSLNAQEAALKAQDAAALTDESKNGLEIVDALENLF